MQLRPDQLAKALDKELAPVYFISGDEPLQQGEAADAVRNAAISAGYDNREVFTVESAFNWNELLQAADSLSIFSERKILDLRLPSGKPGTEGSKVLMEYCQRLPVDTILLITSGKLASASQKTRWFQMLNKVGVILQVWPLDGNDLIRWLDRRMQSRGLQADQNGLQLLASRMEGNLLAAAQEVEKLYVLFGSGKISSQQIHDVVVDSSRYDVFKLVDCILSGQTIRLIRIFQGLRMEGIVAPVVLWALTREIRLLANIKCQIKQGINKQAAFDKYRVWEKRKNLLNSALQRLSDQDIDKIILLCAQVDRQTKGEESGDPWETLLRTSLFFSGSSHLTETV